ncbi:low-affinity zinc ion transporter-like protein [Lizonia empirigonia]|nr:low-affinity zinc ion transporter-like protein [Lizonia empirigonia]
MEVARLVLRQDAGSEADTTPACEGSNAYDGRMGVRISAIFVILVGSTWGAIFPTFAKRARTKLVPAWTFFVAKYFGSGVIIATAFIHLLAPANEALGNPCLVGQVISSDTYPWPEAIALITAFVMFFLELMTMRYAKFGGGHDHDHGDSHSHSHSHGDEHSLPGKRRDHMDNSALGPNWESQGIIPETYAAQLTGVFILEFGVIFHSIFVGLTLAVAGAEFITLYIVLVFHQTFEGLGLGARLAEVPWPKSKRWTPYLLGLGYGISTPIAIAIGLGVRETCSPESATTLIVNGIFDSISAGILIYTGLVELMAHEFMFSPYMQNGPVSRTLYAFALMMTGAGLMALLGYWA